MNYYVVLGVAQNADADTIRSAFRALARRYHPDAGEGSSSDRFREILTAYETLNDPTRRGRYDRTLQNKRAFMGQVVEPLRSRAYPEPMLRRRTGVVQTNVAAEPLWWMSLDELIEEVFVSHPMGVFLTRAASAVERARHALAADGGQDR
jgi:curved DNA-binding protein CbpA